MKETKQLRAFQTTKVAHMGTSSVQKETKVGPKNVKRFSKVNTNPSPQNKKKERK